MYCPECGYGSEATKKANFCPMCKKGAITSHDSPNGRMEDKSRNIMSGGVAATVAKIEKEQER